MGSLRRIPGVVVVVSLTASCGRSNEPNGQRTGGCATSSAACGGSTGKGGSSSGGTGQGTGAGGKAPSDNGGAGGSSNAGTSAGGTSSDGGTGGSSAGRGTGGAGGGPGGASGAGGSGATAGACSTATNDYCTGLPRFAASAQVIDGLGDEFCSVPAMTRQVNAMPWVNPQFAASLPVTVTLRAAWSDAAFHAHVHVTDSNVTASTQPMALYSADNVQFFIAGTSMLTGAYSGTEDGGAKHVILAPPGDDTPRGSGMEFYETGSGSIRVALDSALYAARLVPGGYEVELQLPWHATAAPRAPGSRFGFNFMVGAADEAMLVLEAALANNAPPSTTSCSSTARPGCDTRTWCLPELLR